ncbi:MAG: hypothetical protein Q9167_000379 [Letrouitia subvulpina]
MAHTVSKPTGIPELLGGPTGHFPIEADIVGYLVNTATVPALLGIFAAGCVVVIGFTNLMIKYHNPSLSSADKWAISWFVLTGGIHLFFEGQTT